MKYYYCEYCEEIFSEENAQTVTDFDGYGTRELYACPVCRSTDITDADTCEICGEPTRPDEDICPECAEAMHKAWEASVLKVMDLRMKAGEKLSADYLDCEDAAIEYLRMIGRVL